MDPSEDNCLSLRGPEGEKDPWGLEQGEVGRPRARPVWWSWGEGVGRELEATGRGDRCGEGPIRSPKREGRLAPLVLRWRGRTALLQAPARYRPRAEKQEPVEEAASPALPGSPGAPTQAPRRAEEPCALTRAQKKLH